MKPQLSGVVYCLCGLVCVDLFVLVDTTVSRHNGRFSCRRHSVAVRVFVSTINARQRTNFLHTLSTHKKKTKQTQQMDMGWVGRCRVVRWVGLVDAVVDWVE